MKRHTFEKKCMSVENAINVIKLPETLENITSESMEITNLNTVVQSAVDGSFRKQNFVAIFSLITRKVVFSATNVGKFFAIKVIFKTTWPFTKICNIKHA